MNSVINDSITQMLNKALIIGLGLLTHMMFIEQYSVVSTMCKQCIMCVL